MRKLALWILAGAMALPAAALIAGAAGGLAVAVFVALTHGGTP